MKGKDCRSRFALLVLVVLSVLLLPRDSTAAQATESGDATFVVHCYDVGADALRGRPGVLEVVKGWQGGREVDRVRYDPQTVSVEQLEDWLRAAGTYVRTLAPDNPHAVPGR